MDRRAWTDYRALYLHVPFCRQKCLYCDFASYAGYGTADMERYTQGVCREIAARCGEAWKMAPDATIYFGGGTPSLLPLACLESLVSALRRYGFWQRPLEATIEVNPGTVDLNKLRQLRQLGFDRVSFGVQSLRDGELLAIGRIHNAAQALEAVKWARQAGFERISCDLIYGLPGQTLTSLSSNLAILASLGLEHLSVYGLIVEEGTPLARLVERGELSLPDEDLCADMYELVQRDLRRLGFERYEISNYAKNGQYSRHNMVYWSYRPYIAFGAAACGFDGCGRRTATANVEDYISGAGREAYGSALYDYERLTGAQRLGEFMFMGLRCARGADLAEAKERFGADVMLRFGDKLRIYFERDLLRLEEGGRYLRLTERGMAVGNRIFEIFVTE